VLAESFERIHRSNLVGMGVVPLQYLAGQTADSLGLTGRERFTIQLPEQLVPFQKVTVQVRSAELSRLILYSICGLLRENNDCGQFQIYLIFHVQTDAGKQFEAICRFDTEVELEYYRHGGILHYMIRKLLKTK